MESVRLVQHLAVMLVVGGIAGLFFRRLGLSVVAGYLVAGLLTGASTWFTEVESVHTLFQLGLVFLMFFVGMGLSLERIRRMGFSVLVSTVVTVGLVLMAGQFFARLAGWHDLAGLFFAAMWMVSSTAIITKMLAERGVTHEKSAQRATGLTVVEDIVAVALVVLLTAKTQSGEGLSLAKTMWLLGGFAVLSMVAGLLVMPEVLRRFGRAADNDLKVVLVAGLIFAAATSAALAGFSVALGAFLLGVIVAETPYKQRIERALGGTREMFTAVFFVTAGMMTDLHWLLHNVVWVLGVTLFVLVVRVGSAATALLVGGGRMTGSLRAALILIPIGEFSYVIALLGTEAGAVPESFFSLVVGVSLVTTGIAPFLGKYSEEIARMATVNGPGFLKRSLPVYRAWLHALGERQANIVWWRLSRPRLGQVLLEFLLLAGVLGFASTVENGLDYLLKETGLQLPGWRWIYGAGVTLVTFILAIALWRNVSALSLLYAQVLAKQSKASHWMRGVLEGAMQLAAMVLMTWLVLAVFPFEMLRDVIGLAALGLSGIFAAVFWRRLVRWHSQLRVSLQEAMDHSKTERHAEAIEDSQNWGVELGECLLPEESECGGKTIGALALRTRFGCSVVEIDRQGILLPDPRPETRLFPGDRLLLFGTEGQVRKACVFLTEERESSLRTDDFNEDRLESLTVPKGSPRAGSSLATQEVLQTTGVQVLAIERSGKTDFESGRIRSVGGRGSTLASREHA